MPSSLVDCTTPGAKWRTTPSTTRTLGFNANRGVVGVELVNSISVFDGLAWGGAPETAVANNVVGNLASGLLDGTADRGLTEVVEAVPHGSSRRDKSTSEVITTDGS